MALPNDKPRFTALPLAEAPPRPALPMSKSALCEAYAVSLSTLIRWLRPFLPELEAAGYGIWQKRLTRRQVRIIFEKLDPPDGYTLA